MPRRKSEPDDDTTATEDTTPEAEAAPPEGNQSARAGRVNPDAEAG